MKYILIFIIFHMGTMTSSTATFQDYGSCLDAQKKIEESLLEEDIWINECFRGEQVGFPVFKTPDGDFIKMEYYETNN